MATDITMPRLSDSMEEGTIIKWLVSEGDEIERGQEIAEIETDKANMNFESDTAGEAEPDEEPEAEPEEREDEREPEPATASASSDGSDGNGRVKASPVARR